MTAIPVSQLKAVLEKIAINAMHNGNAVKQVAVDTGKKHVQEDVYDVYEPLMYERTEELKNYMEAYDTPKGLEIHNDRMDDDRDVAYIVETGDGYEHDFQFNGVPRPFMQNTANELNGSKALSDALKRDLNSMGVRTK